jgi:hypothetical protein
MAPVYGGLPLTLHTQIGRPIKLATPQTPSVSSRPLIQLEELDPEVNCPLEDVLKNMSCPREDVLALEDGHPIERGRVLDGGHSIEDRCSLEELPQVSAEVTLSVTSEPKADCLQNCEAEAAREEGEGWLGIRRLVEIQERRGIITVRGQSYVSGLPKYWPPSPPGEFVLPPQQRRGVHIRREERRVGGQYFGRRET